MTPPAELRALALDALAELAPELAAPLSQCVVCLALAQHGRWAER